MVRTKLAMSGLHDPLHQLPTLHALIDIVESMAAESKANEGGDALQRFWFEVYKPTETEVRKKIETEDTDTDFDQFAALGMH